MTERKSNILLIQARKPEDPILKHEAECFRSRVNDPRVSFKTCNIAEEQLRTEELHQTDLVLIGGSGDFSFVKGNFPGRKALDKSMEFFIEQRIPTFASCFGFQALVKKCGGKLVREEDMAELGTYKIMLTEEGKNDPVLGQLPDPFKAQLGHKDSVKDLPNPLTRLAYSKRCPTQAIRHPDAPVLATQFHPELTLEDNLERFNRYIEVYKEQNETMKEARSRVRKKHSESPHAIQLFEHFLNHFLDGNCTEQKQ